MITGSRDTEKDEKYGWVIEMLKPCILGKYFINKMGNSCVLKEGWHVSLWRKDNYS